MIGERPYCSCGGRQHPPLDIDIILSLLSNKDTVIHDGLGLTPSVRKITLKIALKLEMPRS